MATKRAIIAQISAEDLRLVADAALNSTKSYPAKEGRRIRKAAKILATAQAGRPQKEE